MQRSSGNTAKILQKCMLNCTPIASNDANSSQNPSGTTVIKYAILPIGQLYEEAAEARNKHYRSYRQNYVRKFSRCNQDVLNRLLLTSDPYISCVRKRKPSKSQPFMNETIELFEAEELDTDICRPINFEPCLGERCVNSNSEAIVTYVV